MASSAEHDAHLVRWKMMKATGIPYVPDNAIPTYFRQHPEIGSPLQPEQPREGGGVVQAFTGGTLRWTAESGVELVLE